MRFLIILFIFITPPHSFGDPKEGLQSPVSFVEVVNTEASLLNAESKVRAAAVKVVTETGHGSGTYVVFKGHHIVLTAAHVVRGFDSVIIRNENGSEVTSNVIYRDKVHDIAAILTGEIESGSPMKLKIPGTLPRPGTEIFYSGYPSSHNLLTIRGIISGYSGDNSSETGLIIFGYGWFGCSGSGIYDSRGNLIGILWGVDVRMFQFNEQVVEDLIWVSPSSRIDQDLLLSNICNIDAPRNMRGDISCKEYNRKKKESDSLGD